MNEARAFESLTAEAQKEFWASLALRYCEQLSARQSRALLSSYGSALAVYEAAVHPKNNLEPQTKRIAIPKAVVSALKNEHWRIKAHHEWHLAKAFVGQIVLWNDYRYPLGLKQIIDAPPFFYARGDLSLLSTPSVAIVGSRKFHQDTLAKASGIAEHLSACGICVVSGLAKGIDYAAHRGALKQVGKTIAVLGTGADIVYPPHHLALYNEIVEQGLVISEYAPKTAPLPQNFPVRNRIISGLSEAILIAEAALKSGSLITARLGLEQNRHVYVLKPMHENHSLGCHALIQDGAIQVEDAYTIIADIAPNLQEKCASLESELVETPILSPELELSKHKEDFKARYAGRPKNNNDSTQNDMGRETSTSPNIITEFNKRKDYLSHNNYTINMEQHIKNNVSQKQTLIKPLPTQKEKQVHSLSVATGKIYPSDGVKHRPKLENNLPIMDIDFAQVAQELMGEMPTYSPADILANPVRKRISESADKKRKQAKAQADALASNNSTEFDTLSDTIAVPNNNIISTYDLGHDVPPAFVENKHYHINLKDELPPDLNISTLVFDTVNNKTFTPPTQNRHALGHLEQMILTILDKIPLLSPDEIMLQLPKENHDIATVSMTLLMLEVDGYIKRQSGNRYQVV